MPMSYLLIQAQGQILDVTISNPGGGAARMFADAGLTIPVTTWPQRVNGVDTTYYVGTDPSFWNVLVQSNGGITLMSQPFTAGPGQPAVVAPGPSLTQLAARESRAYFAANAVPACEETIPRLFAGGYVSLSSGVARFSAFTARSPLVVNNISYAQAGTASSGLTTNRVALYAVDNNGNLTFLQSSANGGATVAAFSAIVVPLLSPVTLVPGSRYAIGLLYTGTTPGQVFGVYGTLLPIRLMDNPWIAASLSASDLTAAALASAAYVTLSGVAAFYMRVS